MLRLLNGILVIGLLAAAYFVYALEHETRSGERNIARLKAQIKQENENIKLLNAEWGFLTRPERIEHLARKHLELEVMSPLQTITEADLDMRLPAEPVIAPGTPLADPIGDVLNALEAGQQ